MPTTELPIDQYTSLRLNKSTRDRLAKLGKKDDTFDDIIKRLLDEHESRIGK